MTLSVTTPLDRAFARTRAVLFAPFDLGKWFTLGFCAFLANLGDGSGSGGGNLGSWNGHDGRQRLEQGLEWLRENWELVVTIGAAVVLVVLAIAITVLWLQARGRFLFLDGVVQNRGAVVEPWHTYRAEANSAFRFKLCLSLAGFAGTALAVGLGLALAWRDIDAQHFGPAAWTGLAVGGTLLFLFVATVTLIDVFLNDFVVPAMYARRIGALEGWGVVWREVLTAHTGAVVLYLLMKILISIVLAILIFAAICVTLCIAACFLAIPYIGTVLLLPVFVFGRCYSLCFLDQLGGAWELIPRSEEPGPAPL